MDTLFCHCAWIRKLWNVLCPQCGSYNFKFYMNKSSIEPNVTLRHNLELRDAKKK